uniref:hypothetical protein n=1 Tax=Candidatus Electronema sp. TaxID=2698783 RepID=UPI004057665F
MNGEPVTINISQYTACGGTSNGSFSLAPSQSKTISVKPGTGFTLDLGSAIRAQIKFNGSGSHPAISWKQPDPLSGTVKISTGGSPATVTMEVTTVP